MHPAHEQVAAECDALILRGRAAESLVVLQAVSEPARDTRWWLLLGDAERAVGDYPAAFAAYARVAPPTGDLPLALAWRMGAAHYAKGDPRSALESYARAEPEGTAVDRACLLAGEATAHWLLGHGDLALARAQAARGHAEVAGEPRVLAAAHIALGLTLSLNGDPATVEEEYGHAARYAAAAGDLAQLARVEVNRSHHLLADARFAEAVERAAAGGALAAEIGAPAQLAVALGNEAEGLLRLGREAEALERCERALSLAAEIGSRRTASALVGLAQIQLRRGCREQARAALEQALRLHTADPDRQVRVPALAALAVTVLVDDVERASELAGEALAEATGSAVLPALLAAGRTAQARGDAPAAQEHADRAVEHARRRRERAWLAEALELRAALGAGQDHGSIRSALREAYRIWLDAGAGHDADRVLVQLAQLSLTSVQDRRAARLAAARLRADGYDQTAAGHGANTSVRIATFGRFEVMVDGAPVPAEAWQSRRARDLLRLLVCRRGRAVPRLEICEALWPDDDPDRTAHRLSVLLSIVRGAVGPETILANQGCVALNRVVVAVDVEDFLIEVADGIALEAGDASPESRAVLVEAVRSYTDEPFADTPYDDATTPLRDEAKATLVQALRALARSCRQSGEHDQAAGYLRRLLAEDRYDEDAHRALLAVLNRAGRHGQARVAAARYRSAMGDLGLRPAV